MPCRETRGGGSAVLPPFSASAFTKKLHLQRLLIGGEAARRESRCMMGYKNVGKPGNVGFRVCRILFLWFCHKYVFLSPQYGENTDFSPVFTVDGLHGWGTYWLLFGRLKK